MFWHCYLRQGNVYVPTVGRIDKGFYGDTEPVAVISVSDREGLSRALRDTIMRGNPTIPNLPRANQPPPVVLKYTGVKTWGVFARGTSNWQVEERGGVFQIMPTQKGAHGGWVVNRAAIVTLPSGSTIDDVVERLVAILQDAARSGAASTA